MLVIRGGFVFVGVGVQGGACWSGIKWIKVCRLNWNFQTE